MKSRTLDGSGLHDIWFYISYGRLKPTHYNVRFKNAQGQEIQVEISGEGTRSAIRNLGVIPGRRYVIKSQACTRQLFGSSQCTRWYTTTFTAKSA